MKISFATRNGLTISQSAVFAFALLCFSQVDLATALADTRTWTSANGSFTLEAEEIAFDDSTVVLKKSDGNLVAVELSELSEADREYVQSKEAEEGRKSAEKMQTWTSVDGMKIQGRVIAYGKKDVAIQRKRGKVFVGEVEFSQKEPLQQRVILKVISKLEKKDITDEKQLIEWAKSLGSQPKVYPLEGVLLELESGDEVGVPFFMFAEEDLKILEPGWKHWLEQHESEDRRDYESLMVRAQAQAYQADRQAQRQIETLKLGLLATATGVTSIWQVALVPPQGRFGRPMTVMVTARDSQTAEFQAMQRYPGYVVAGVRKLSN